MTGWLNVAALLGRVLLSGIFIASGVQKLMYWEQTAEYMRSEGMSAVTLLLAGAVIVELGGGLAVLLGWWSRLAAFILIAFLVPTSLIFHDFWAYDDPEVAMNQMQHFMKNLTIMGGLFMVVAHGPGRISVDGPKMCSIGSDKGASDHKDASDA